MTKNQVRLAAVFIALALSLTLFGCSNEDEEVKKLINEQINLIEREVQAVEEHQQNLKMMIGQMQTQLKAMQAELEKESPRIKAAQTSVAHLRDLSNQGLGESPAESTLRNPSWNFLWLILFVLLMWFFYRLRVKAAKKSQ